METKPKYLFVFLLLTLVGVVFADPSIRMVVPDTLTGTANTQFLMEIEVGNPNPVNQLIGASFFISWDDTTLVEAIDATAGSFLGSSPIFLKQIYADHLEIGISSTTGGHSGQGQLVQISFNLKKDVGTSQTVHFTISNISAIDAGGESGFGFCSKTGNSGLYCHACIGYPRRSIQPDLQFRYSSG